MEKLKPKLFSVMKSYTKEQFVKDVIAGIIVAIIALPLSIALALASGVTPEKGIYTAITAGFVISFLGGSRVQIAGPTAAFATIVAGIVAKNGIDGLIIATLLAGVILILMGFLRLGNLIKFIPYTITTGFTSGIAVTIFIGQIKDFLGLTIVSEEPLIETMDKLKAVFQFISTTNLQALLVGVISLLILIVWQYLPGFCKKIPPSLIAVLVGSAMVALLNMNVNTIGDLYEISNKLPTISLPSFSLKTVQNVLPDAFTIAILAAIESLLSCVVADSMVNSRHRSNMELIAQGAGNSGLSLVGWAMYTGDGISMQERQYMKWDKEAGTGGGNYGMYDNPDVSAKIMEAMQEMDTAKRGEMVKEIDRMVLDDVANIPLFFNENIFGVRDSIEYTPRYDRYLLAWEISFK